MYSEEHPEAEQLGKATQELLGWLNNKVEGGKPFTINDSRDVLRLTAKVTEETIVRAIGVSAARLYGIEDGE